MKKKEEAETILDFEKNEKNRKINPNINLTSNKYSKSKSTRYKDKEEEIEEHLIISELIIIQNNQTK